VTRRGFREFARKAGSYGSVSFICFIVNNLLLIGLDSLGQPLWLNLVVSAALMIAGGFILQAFFTFGAPLSWPAFGRYTLMMLPNVPLAYGLLWLLSQRLSIPMHYSAPLATTLLLLWNAVGSAWAFQGRSRRT
jgi:putative flippase GtrA